MKISPKFWLALGALAAVLCIAFFFMAAGPDKANESSAATTTSGKPAPNLHQEAATLSTEAIPRQTPGAGASSRQTELASVTEKSPSTNAPATKEQVLADINEAAISYSAKELPRIQPYLSHSDPELRAAALAGVMTISDAAGAPLLRAAAKLIADPREAAKLLDNADFLELPSGTLLQGKPNRTPSPVSPPLKK